MAHYPRALICLSLCFICCAVASLADRYKDYEIVIPRKVNELGEFVSHSLSHYHKRDEDGPSDNLHYSVPISGRDHHLELLPNRKISSPGALVETISPGGTKGFKRMRGDNNQCHFGGTVRGVRGSRAALSTCNGLAGYIRTDDGHYLIEPAAPTTTFDPHPHVVYKDSGRDAAPTGNCGSDIRRRNARDGVNATAGIASVDVPIEMHIESLVVLDQAILRYRKEIDIENFVLTVFNMAHDLFHDGSLGYNINLAIVRLIRLEDDDHEMNVSPRKNPRRALEHFRKWQNRINPRDDDHPNHHDVAVLLTRIDMCGDDRSCGLLGMAKLAGICDPDNQAVICQDNGLRLGFTIVHQIGHALGMLHDIDDRNETSIMDPYISPKMNHWSPCSRRSFANFINSGLGACLYDPPTDHSFVLMDALPGVMYDADYQCKELFGPNAGLCMTGLDCSNLICHIEDKGCVESHMPPADGTNCGENKWCFAGGCVEKGERPGAEDGGWGKWGEWSECTRTCGSGVASQERHCDHPPPMKGGKFCAGESKRYKICSTEPCDLYEPSFRDVQCSEFDSWVYPEDGKVHVWRSYPIHDENPCGLYCVNDEGGIASLRPRVIDGTTCYHGIRDICINGMCKEIPCDLDLQSSAVEDRCGICKGDGTTCKVTRDTRLFQCDSGIEEEKFVEIPKGAVNIKVEEMMPSESRIEVRDKDGKDVYIAGTELGTFNVKGTKAWVGMIRLKQEAISIPGPLPDPISIWIGVQQNTTIKYSYGTKETHKRKPSFSWDFLDWSRCSTECGPGTQEAIPKCVEKEAGQVDEKYCKDVPKLKSQIRPCELAPCTPKWFVGDWSQCSKCPRGIRTRILKCFIPVGTGEGELDLVSDNYCISPKPRTRESCSCNPKSGRPTNVTKLFDVIDSMDVTQVHLTVHTDFDGKSYPSGLPHPKNANESVFDLEDKEALKFMDSMQRNFENSKSRI